jgi:uncharacterized membrane protein YcaP (DUF421 family)
MKKGQIQLWDLKRILLGQAPPEFLLEVFIRSLVVYIITIIIMRWMGKRMNGQHSIIELAVMVMMGAIVSVPMQIPDRGILQGVAVLLVTLLLLRSINWLSFYSAAFEKTVQGNVIILVKDGIIQPAELTRTKITHQQLFEVLRSKNIFNLGKVKRMYVEASGVYSIYQEQEPKPGLPVYPQTDQTIYDTYAEEVPGQKACTNCGHVQSNASAQCTNCGKDTWAKAIT